MFLTIFTPTYNRAHLLPRLYDSLNAQTVKNFEWLIVDDGSTDNTKDLISTWTSQESSFPIRYIYQENGGKHIAHNTGVLNANGDLFFCVDSDDIVPPTVAEILENECRKNIFKENTSGIIGLKADFRGIMLGSIDEITDVNYIAPYELYSKFHFSGELAQIYLTKILREYLFPEISGTKFITEAVVYNRIGRKYNMFLLKEIVTICEYQEDGYSQNMSQIARENPTGFKIYWMEKIDMENQFLYLLLAILNYLHFSRLSNDRTYSYGGGEHATLVSLLCPMGFCMSILLDSAFGVKTKVVLKKLLQRLLNGRIRLGV